MKGRPDVPLGGEQAIPVPVLDGPIDNAKKRPFLSRIMCEVTGAQENGFKKLKAHGVDLIHSYEKEPYSEEYLLWLKMSALWSRKRIVDIVKPHYQDLRDVEKFVDGILQSRTYVRTSDGVMYVEFPDQRSRQKQQVLQRLCEELNERGTINIGLSVHKLVFSVR